MANSQTEISCMINTIEDMLWNPLINDYLDSLESFIEDGHVLVFYRKGSDDKLTTIKDVDHFNNFKRTFKNRIINTY